jgi:uncharacterized protein with GYD domain
MARFLLLLKFTDKGIAQVKESPSRATAFREAAAKAGVTVEAQYWLLGEYDGAAVLTAADEPTATAAVLKLGSQGFVHTCLCRAFDEREFKAVAAKT